MKLLFDHNLSPDLVGKLSDLFPKSEHVFRLSLHECEDRRVWAYAKKQKFILVTKDVDFSELSLRLGHPPKVIWIRLGNCSTRQIEKLLRQNYGHIKLLNETAKLSVLSLK